MAYEDAFAAVPGVTVEWCQYFGSYQGRLAAKIRREGKTEPEYILDYYGSCSGCDSYEAEMPWNPTKEALAAFGAPYVNAALSLDEALQKLMPQPGEYYDYEEKEMLDRILQDYPEKKALVGMFPKGSA